MWTAGIAIFSLVAPSTDARQLARRATTTTQGTSFTVNLVRNNLNTLPAVELTAGNTTITAAVGNSGTYTWVAGADCSQCTQAGLDITSLKVANNASCTQPLLSQLSLNDNATVCPVNSSISFGSTSYQVPSLQVLTDYPVSTNSNLSRRFNLSGAIGFANSYDWDRITERCLPQVLFDEGYISEPSLGVYIAPDNSTLGELTFGDPRTSKWCDNTTGVVLPQRPQGLPPAFADYPSGYNQKYDQYAVHFESFKSNGKNVTAGSAALVAMNSLIWQLPENISFPLIKELFGGQATYDNSSVSWTLPCNYTSSANISLALGGVDWPIPASDFVSLNSENGTCHTSLINCAPDTPRCPAFLGIQFMKNVYSVFEADTQAMRLYKVKQQNSTA